MDIEFPENIVKLGVKFKAQQDHELTVIRKDEYKCWHGQYLVDEKKAEIECGKCGEKLNPIWVLCDIANNDRRMKDARQRYNEEMKRLDERKTTKCRHCHKMTRISFR